jgi:proteasome-associated ATPase
MNSEERSRSLALLDKVEEVAPKDNVRLQNYLSALKSEIESESKTATEREALLAEYETAYQKLTAPANRIGTFLQWNGDNDEFAMVTMGDTEYVCQVDDKVKRESLVAGTRVKLNEAYAVIGVLPGGQTGGIVKVGSLLEDGRMRLGSETPGSGDTRIILRSAALADASIQPGDEVRLDSTGRFAVEHFERQESKDYFLEEISELPWDQVGGQEQAINTIRETIEQPLLHPEIFAAYDQKPIKGLLLYGPPGCGKTLIGKATAYNLTREYEKQVGRPVKEYFMTISGPKILNMWLGETERMVREIFRTAREKAKEGRLVFIFMDEAESVLRTRSSGRYLNISNTVVPQFCAELDGMHSLDNVVLMLTSNRPDYIDPAVLRPGRIDRKVKVTRPDRAASQSILGIYLTNKLPYDPALLATWDGEVDCARKQLIESTIDYLWRAESATEFLRVFLRTGSNETLHYRDLVSGAILKSIVDRAKSSAIRRAIASPSEPHGIGIQDMHSAVDLEFKENEIFPKTDAVDDWLQLLDLSPENVVTVKPIGLRKEEELARKFVV